MTRSCKRTEKKREEYYSNLLAALKLCPLKVIRTMHALFVNTLTVMKISYVRVIKIGCSCRGHSSFHPCLPSGEGTILLYSKPTTRLSVILAGNARELGVYVE